MGIEKLVRKEVFNFSPYVPGKPIKELERELKGKGLKLKNIIKLASNENPRGPSKKAVAGLKNYLEKIYLYPESNCPDLRNKLAIKLGVKPENLIFGNGSDEIIELIGKTFLNPGDEIIVSEHAFIRYRMAAELMGSKVITIPMKNYTHDLQAMLEAVTPKTKVVFIANPNNPTGTYNTKQEFDNSLLQIANYRLQILVVVDEAYYEYAKGEKGYPDTLSYLKAGKNIIILRTFSKIYGLAGLRVGYGIAKKEIIDFLERIRPPFNVNSLAQEAALVSLNDRTQVKKSVQLVEEGKKYLYRELKKLGLNYVPSAANFILIEMKKRDEYLSGKEVFTELLEEGVIVRAMEEYGFPEYIRVTVGLPEENKKFIRALRKCLGSSREEIF